MLTLFKLLIQQISNTGTNKRGRRYDGQPAKHGSSHSCQSSCNRSAADSSPGRHNCSNSASSPRYAACPCIRHTNGFYYVLYLEQRAPRWFFETYIARSADLKTWELSGANPVLSPQGLDEGINAAAADEMIALTLTAVAVSIVVHGISVTPLMARYARRLRKHGKRRR